MVVSLTAATPEKFGAGQVGVTVVTGILIVFAVLTVIFVALMIMQSIFTKNKKQAAYTVVAPFDAGVDYLVALPGAVKAGEVVMVVSGDSGKSEVLAPGAGKLKLSVQRGSSVKKGDTLFTID